MRHSGYFRRFALSVTCATLLCLCHARLASASLNLRFDPADTTIAPADTFTVSVMIDDELDLRTIEGYLIYDPTVLIRVGAWPGQLFDNQGPGDGCPESWNDCEEDVAGQLHFYAITLGPQCWITGPGELYVLQFTAIGSETTTLTATEIILYNTAGSPLDEEIILPDLQIEVADPETGTLPGVPGFRFDLFPNPFNPRVTLTFAAPTPRPAKIIVLDVRGRRVATIWEGIIGDAMTTTWDGITTFGRPAPSGQYWFRLEYDEGHLAMRKGVLLK